MTNKTELKKDCLRRKGPRTIGLDCKCTQQRYVSLGATMESISIFDDISDVPGLKVGVPRVPSGVPVHMKIVRPVYTHRRSRKPGVLHSLILNQWGKKFRALLTRVESPFPIT